MTFIGKDSECLPRFVGSHLHSPEVAKHLDVWPPHHQSHCHLCIGAVGLRRQWSSAWWNQSRALFKSSPNNHSNPGYENSQNIIKKNTFVSQNSPRKIQGLAWRTHCGTKAQDSSEGCPCGTWSYQQGSLSINWSCLPLPLEGTTPVEMWEQLTKKTESWWHIFLEWKWKVIPDKMKDRWRYGNRTVSWFCEDGRMFFRIVILFFVKVSHACIIFILTSTH